MVLDLNFDIAIVGCPIVREHDGLAMSSRNVYLSDAQRASALSLNQSLKSTQQYLFKGVIDTETLINKAKDLINSQQETKIEYIRICHKDTLDDIQTVNEDCLMALAVHVGKTRLIDNTILQLEK